MGDVPLMESTKRINWQCLFPRRAKVFQKKHTWKTKSAIFTTKTVLPWAATECMSNPWTGSLWFLPARLLGCQAQETTHKPRNPACSSCLCKPEEPAMTWKSTEKVKDAWAKTSEGLPWPKNPLMVNNCFFFTKNGVTISWGVSVNSIMPFSYRSCTNCWYLISSVCRISSM